MDDTKTRIILAAIKVVRQYGLEGVRIQNVSELAGISSGAIYRHFDGKEQLLIECFTYMDKQAAGDPIKFRVNDKLRQYEKLRLSQEWE